MGTRMSRNCGRARSSPCNCPTGDQVFLSRKKSNHFADASRSKSERQRFQSVGEARSRASSSSGRVTDHLDDEAFVSVNLSLQQDTHKNILKLDTGAQGNTFPLRFYREMYPQNLQRKGQTTPQMFHLNLGFW